MLLKICHNRYIECVEDSLKSNNKNFWKYNSSLKQSNSGYPHIMKYGNTLSSDPNAIVEMFSQYFQSVVCKWINSFTVVVNCNGNTFRAPHATPYIPVNSNAILHHTTIGKRQKRFTAKDKYFPKGEIA
ncbi:unnamed protein product [Leptidea sinapis]|uniref:Uncharacterized protein n=1 Tax=Leptidea sinapis TaxID=189913 RepID=A0A5E4R8J5_9NEOP|nr:unnamed protein product [Leptidea sinapis]